MSSSSSYLISTDANKCGSIELNNDGGLKQMTMYPVAPNPDNMPAKATPGGISTQWLVKHPTLPLVIALTSYWNAHPAQLTCFQLGSDNLLTKLPGLEASTKGREAVHAVFSPLQSDSDSDTITLAVSHHNDGFVSFFTFSTKEIPTSMMEQPTATLELPELVEGTKKVLPTNAKVGLSKPSSHHVLYDPNGKFLWVVDPNQCAILTYPCDPKTGLPVGVTNTAKTPMMPANVFNCHTDSPSLSWLGSIVGTFLMGLSCRPRRIALSPNGEFMYVLYETRNVIQVYGVNPKTGEIDTSCLQEVSTLDTGLVHRPVVGLTFQGAAEMIVFENSLFVSNRGSVLGGVGKGENSIRVFSIKDGGRLVTINPKAVVCSGPVRHFTIFHDTASDKQVLIAGTSQPGQSLQTFSRSMDRSPQEDQPNDFTLVGEANVEVNVFCVLPAAANTGGGSGSGGDTTTSSAATTTKAAAEKSKKEIEIENKISQMEDQAMNGGSSENSGGDDDAVFVDAQTTSSEV